MREIKFRGWQPELKKWILGSLVTMPQGGAWILDYKNGFEDRIRIDANTVGQFWIPSFGLECYGGDLLSAFCSVYVDQKPKERICKVNDTDRGFGISIWYKGEWLSYSSMNFSTAKVIGNIHEHPELLES